MAKFVWKIVVVSRTVSYVQSSIIYACMASLGKPSYQVIAANNPNSKVGVIAIFTTGLDIRTHPKIYGDLL